MSNINIILPYNECNKYFEKWAHEENSIDFKKEIERAKRCTLSFAAEELRTYLTKLGFEVCVSDKEDNEAQYNIELAVLGDAGEEFDIECDSSKIKLTAEGRRGILYAVYELLEAQGIRWYAPELEYVPAGNDGLILPESKHYKYDLQRGRGFHFEQLLKGTNSLLMWMIRNRMNMHGYHAYSGAFQKKLGMIFKTGGHIFEKILNPLNIDENGEYYINAHKEWYGKRDEEITAENAIRVQFCVSDEELLDKLADTVIDRMNNEWKNENILELAGFDTWGSTCNCEKCKKLGNGSDITMHFISHIRKRINEAYEKGIVDRQVTLVFDIYEGTNTMHAPINPVPQNMLDAGDCGMYSPILRCYKHDIYDDNCGRNKGYHKDYEEWIASGLSIAINEYYNVSRFEDLPILFNTRIQNDMKYYIEKGAATCEYMHVPLVEWGVKTITEYLYANMMRNKDTDCKKLADEYYRNIYGQYSNEIKDIYETIEEATEYCASWRAWNRQSTLTHLWEWNGMMPEKPLYRDCDIKEDALGKGRKMIRLLKDALVKLRSIRTREMARLEEYDFSSTTFAVNPIEQARMQSRTKLLDKLNEDIRSVKYGVESFDFLITIFEYYEALYYKDKEAKVLFEKIVSLGETLSEYTFGIWFSPYEPEMGVRTALKRTQLDDLYYKLIAHKKVLEEI